MHGSLARGFATAALLLGVVAFVGCASAPPFDMEPYRSFEAPAAPADFEGVTVTFMGVSTLIFSDGTTTLIIDGFFSRPDLGGVNLLRAIAPDAARVDAALAQAGVSEAAAITVVHSHYDHAMDTPLVAERTGALVLGSESTANIARGWGLPETQIRVVEPGEAASFGAFTMRWLPSKHYPLPAPVGSMMLGTRVDEPLQPPASVTAWGEGRSDSIVIEHPRGTTLVQGSAGFLPGALANVGAEVVMLGIGGLASETPTYRADYWAHTVGAVGGERVYAVHWDDFSRPLSEPLAPSGSDGGGFPEAMRFLESKAAESGAEVGLLPFAVPVALY